MTKMAEPKKGFNIWYAIIPIIIAAVVIPIVVVVLFMLPGGGPAGGDVAGTLGGVKGTLGDVSTSSTGLKNALAAGTGVTEKVDAFSSSVDDYAAQSAAVSGIIGGYTGSCDLGQIVAEMNNYDFSIAAALLYLEAYTGGDAAAKAEAEGALANLLNEVGAEGTDLGQAIETLSDCLGTNSS